MTQNVVQFFGNVPSNNADAALWYAEKMGWRVMPLHAMRMTDGKLQCSCGDDEKCPSPGKHPLVKNGEATHETETVKKWWKKWPWANIGFWLEGSGLAALDIDISPDKDGAARLREILAGQPLPETLVCATPSGGKHIYYKDREGLPNKSNALGAGLDIWRGKHYLILPPSNHKRGGLYQWEKSIAPAEWPDILFPKSRGPGRPAGTPNPNAGRPATRERLDIRDKDDVARLAHALTFVSGTDRDTWVHVGYVLARCFGWGDKGFEIFREWSAAAPNYDAKKTEQIYYRDSRNPPEGMSITTAYIFKVAMAHPNYVHWEKKDQRLKFYENVGQEAADLYQLAGLVNQANLDFYEREGRLIEVIRISRMTEGERERLLQQGIKRSDAYCITRELTPGQFILRSSGHIAWWGKVRNKMQNIDYNRRTVLDFLGMGAWPGMKRFKAFTLHPTLRSLSNPTLLLDSGFDEESGLYLEQDHLSIAPFTKVPTLKEARAAVTTLLSPFDYFAFIDGQQSRSNLLALILTIGIRHCFKTSPMFLATSPIVGSGKTKLVGAASAIWYGAEPPSMMYVENEEEMEKRIGASIMAGDRVMLFDNVIAKEVVNDRTLNMILTSGQAQFRILGESQQVRMSAPMTIMMTGNQMSLGPDLARRTIPLTIDPQGPLPTSRSFPWEPVDFVKEHRQKLIEAALTILHAYFSEVQAGKLMPGNPVASFEEWSVIRDIVLWLGMEDVGQFSRPKIEDDDLYYPNVVKRVVEMLVSVRPDIDLFVKHSHPADIMPLLSARGKEWETLYHDALEVIGYSVDRAPKMDDPRSVGALLSRMTDQTVKLDDGRSVRLKSIKRRSFWLMEG